MSVPGVDFFLFLSLGGKEYYCVSSLVLTLIVRTDEWVLFYSDPLILSLMKVPTYSFEKSVYPFRTT